MKSVCASTAIVVLALAGALAPASAQERVSARNDSAYPVRLSIEPATIAGAAADSTTFSLKLENTSNNSIVAYTIRYGQAGEEAPTHRHVMSFFAAAKDRMIEPGGSRTSPQGLGLRQDERVEAHVDLIVFADGSAVGPNYMGDTRIVNARLQAQRQALSELLTRIQNRAPNPAIQKMVQDEIAAFPTAVRHRRPGIVEDVAQAAR